MLKILVVSSLFSTSEDSDSIERHPRQYRIIVSKLFLQNPCAKITFGNSDVIMAVRASDKWQCVCDFVSYKLFYLRFIYGPKGAVLLPEEEDKGRNDPGRKGRIDPFPSR